MVRSLADSSSFTRNDALSPELTRSNCSRACFSWMLPCLSFRLYNVTFEYRSFLPLIVWYCHQETEIGEFGFEHSLHQLFQHCIPVLAVNNPFVRNPLIGPWILSKQNALLARVHTLLLSWTNSPHLQNILLAIIDEHRDAFFFADTGLHRFLLSIRHGESSIQRDLVAIASVIRIDELLNGDTLQIVVHPVLRGIAPMILPWSNRLLLYDHTTGNDDQTVLFAQRHESFLRARNQLQLLIETRPSRYVLGVLLAVVDENVRSLGISIRNPLAPPDGPVQSTC